jgi:hypothetical protein
MKFYGRDWLGDPALRMVAPEVRGVWIDLLCAMSLSEPYGHLAINGAPMADEQAARMAGLGLGEYRAILATIEAAGISSRTPDGVLYSRRLVREHAAFAVLSDAGKRGGGNPHLAHDESDPPLPESPPTPPSTTTENTETIYQKPEAKQPLKVPFKPTFKGTFKPTFKPPTPDEVAEYAKSIEYALNGEEFVAFYESKGWKIGSAPMKSWRAAVKTWKHRHASGYTRNTPSTGRTLVNTWHSDGDGGEAVKQF